MNVCFLNRSLTLRIVSGSLGLFADIDKMMHGTVTHVVDIGGRFALKLHGIGFENMTLVLYVGELINNAKYRRREPNRWVRVKGEFQ